MTFWETAEELDALLAEGLASEELLSESEFWDAVEERTSALLRERNRSS
jgi:hypothetical protein